MQRLGANWAGRHRCLGASWRLREFYKTPLRHLTLWQGFEPTIFSSGSWRNDYFVRRMTYAERQQGDHMS
jgi:hypothetical protein